jgi:outer membrane protein OmpA-like peptidoglycan-associated protein
VGLALAVLMSGCATKAYVNEQIAAVNGRMDGKSGELSGRIDQNSSRLNQQQAALDGVSRTAQEALDRANAAGKLAEGKFMYEMSLSSQIAFKVDSSVLTPAAKEALDAFVTQLKSNNKNVYIEIQGHTDSTGSAASNMKLAQARAESVHRYLAINGKIALHRMNVISYGETAPVADNKTHAGRVENRRVTLIVLQ